MQAQGPALPQRARFARHSVATHGAAWRLPGTLQSWGAARQRVPPRSRVRGRCPWRGRRRTSQSEARRATLRAPQMSRAPFFRGGWEVAVRRPASSPRGRRRGPTPAGRRAEPGPWLTTRQRRMLRPRAPRRAARALRRSHPAVAGRVTAWVGCVWGCSSLQVGQPGCTRNPGSL